MGRPSKFSPAFCDQVKKLCRLGATDIEIADFLGVNVATLYRWKNDHPSFCEALKEGKTEADARVVESLYQRAVGYSFDSEKVQVLRDGAVVRVPIREHVPPDTTAAIFWLKNRAPADWRDVQQHEHRFAASEMSDAELARIARGRGDGASEAPRNPSVTH